MQVDPQAVDLYAKMRKKQVQYMVLTISDDASKINLEDHKEGYEGLETLNDLLQNLEDNEPRYILTEFTFTHEGRYIAKTVLIVWVPSTSPIKKKVLYSSQQSQLKFAFSGIQHVITFDSKEGANAEYIQKTLMKETIF